MGSARSEVLKFDVQAQIDVLDADIENADMPNLQVYNQLKQGQTYWFDEASDSKE